MKYLAKLLWLLPACMLSVSCKKSASEKAFLVQKDVVLSTHKLSTYSSIQNSKYLIVFESGLGDSHTVWKEDVLLKPLAEQGSLMVYDRAFYGKSGKGPAPRNIATLSTELAQVIDQLAGSKKVILVGHSLGGMIIRDYAVKHPEKTAAILFIDASNEYYNRPTQAQEDMIYNIFNSNYGPDFGGSREARELIEDGNYMATLPALPNVPVVAITSVKTDADHDAADRKKWFDSHELMGAGLTDFTHIGTTRSGHYIMADEPELVIQNIRKLIAKLP